MSPTGSSRVTEARSMPQVVQHRRQRIVTDLAYRHLNVKSAHCNCISNVTGNIERQAYRQPGRTYLKRQAMEDSVPGYTGSFSSSYNNSGIAQCAVFLCFLCKSTKNNCSIPNVAELLAYLPTTVTTQTYNINVIAKSLKHY